MYSLTSRIWLAIVFIAATALAAPPRPTLDQLDEILTRAGSLDAFLASPTLLTEYYEALNRFQGGGEGQFPRRAFDNIIQQLIEVAPKVDGLKERLWQTTQLGEGYSVRVKMGRDSYNRAIDLPRWKSYYERMAMKLAKDAEPIEDDQKLKKVLERVKKQREAIDREAIGLSKPRATALRSDRMAVINADPELRAAEAYLAHRFVTSEGAVDKNNGGNPDLILYFYRDARNNPTHLYRLLDPELASLAEATLSRARNLLPSVDEMLKPEHGIFKAQHSDLKPNELVDYHFDPIKRRFHGIFWGARMGACVGGRDVEHLSPEFWASIALEESRLHAVSRNGEFHGWVGMNPGGVHGETYASLALAAPDLAKQMVRVDPSTGEETPSSLFSIWLDEAIKHKPEHWKGFVLSDSESFNNWGTHAAGRRLAQYVLGDPLGSGKDFVHADPMARAIIDARKPTGLAKSYAGNMILDATVPSAKNLTVLRPDIDEALLGEANRVRAILMDNDHPLRLRLANHLAGDPSAAKRFETLMPRLLNDADPAIRRRAIAMTAATHADRQEAMEALIALMKDPSASPPAMTAAKQTLKKLGESGHFAAAAIEAHLFDDSHAVRLAIAETLSNLRNPDGTKLTRALLDPIREARAPGDPIGYGARKVLESLAVRKIGDAALVEPFLKQGTPAARLFFARLRARLGHYGAPYTDTMLDLAPGEGMAEVQTELLDAAKAGHLDVPTIETHLRGYRHDSLLALMKIYLAAGGGSDAFGLQAMELQLRHPHDYGVEHLDTVRRMSFGTPTPAMRQAVIDWAAELRAKPGSYWHGWLGIRVLSKFPADPATIEAAHTIIGGRSDTPKHILVEELGYAIKVGAPEAFLLPGLKQLSELSQYGQHQALQNAGAEHRTLLFRGYLNALASENREAREIAIRALLSFDSDYRKELKTFDEGALPKAYIHLSEHGEAPSSTHALRSLRDYLPPADAQVIWWRVARGKGPGHLWALSLLGGSPGVSYAELLPLALEYINSPNIDAQRIGYVTIAQGPPTADNLRLLEAGIAKASPEVRQTILNSTASLLYRLEGDDPSHREPREIASRISRRIAEIGTADEKNRAQKILNELPPQFRAKRRWWHCFTQRL